jgi:hypothetical protein
MNAYKTHHDYEPDEANAHYVALNKMKPDDLERGDLSCVDYLLEFDREMGIPRPAPPNLLSMALNNLPSIHESPEVAQHLTELYQASGLEVPVGLLDLPLQWAKAFHDLVCNTHWPTYRHCTFRDVIEWNHVLSFGGYLHIQFARALPHRESHWNEVGYLIRELHQKLEPGPYTEPGRLIEFL